MPTFRKISQTTFTKVILSEGNGFTVPQIGSKCKIKVLKDATNLVSGLDEDKVKELVVGDFDDSLSQIIDDCIRTMKKKEICCVILFLPLDVIDDNVNPESNHSLVNPGTSNSNTDMKESFSSEMFLNNSNTNTEQTALVKFQLLSFTKRPEIFEMTVSEKWNRATYYKQQGVDMYYSGLYKYAFNQFSLAMKFIISLQHDDLSNHQEGMDINALKLSCYLNLSACQMKNENFESAIVNCSKALNLQPHNTKALFRRGKAYIHIQEYEKGEEDLTVAQQLEPKNKAIAKQLGHLRRRVQKLNRYYANAMKKLFS